jgi:3-oxoacyl-[acyl-carrier-protein] synthase II
VDAAIAGAFDDGASWWNISKFDAMGILTTRNDLGAAACRPYDRDRTGTVSGEGAALLVLEEYEAAAARGARIYAEVTGFGSAFDAYRIITPEPEGGGLARAITSALSEAGSLPDAIGYAATHGNGTRMGDPSEAQALRAAFGASADTLAASSVTAATGYLVAGAGALNAAVAALALEHQVAPPTLNLEIPDPACDLDWVTQEARPLQAEQALATALGLEGQDVALTLARV